MTSDYSIIYEEGEEIEQKNEKLHSIYLEFLQHYVTLSKYYIAQDTFK